MFLINLVYLFHIVFHCILLFVSVAHRDLTVYALINMALLLLYYYYSIYTFFVQSQMFTMMGHHGSVWLEHWTRDSKIGGETWIYPIVLSSWGRLFAHLVLQLPRPRWY